MNPHKQMMYDDIPILIGMLTMGGSWIIDGDFLAGLAVFIPALFFFAARLYHLTHQAEVFK